MIDTEGPGRRRLAAEPGQRREKADILPVEPCAKTIGHCASLADFRSGLQALYPGLTRRGDEAMPHIDTTRTLIGGLTVWIELAGLRLHTDRTFDAPASTNPVPSRWKRPAHPRST